MDSSSPAAAEPEALSAPPLAVSAGRRPESNHPGSAILRYAPGVLLSTGLACVAYLVAGLPGLKVLGPLTLALVVGMGVRALSGKLPATAVEGTKLSARTLLRLGIVLMGARLSFDVVAKVGPKVLVLDLAVVTLGIAGIGLLAKKLGVPARLATLLAVGTSVCGASAAVAAGSVVKAEEEEVTLAVALCGVLGTVGVLAYVFGGPLLALSTTQLAVLSGSTLHEVAQVMAAAFTWGTQSGDLGTLVKLTRVVMLAPALVVLGLATRQSSGVRYSLRNPPVPWFVLGFIALGAVSSLGLIPTAAKAALSTASVFLMVVSMAAMGLNTPLQMLKRAGLRVVWAGLLGFFGLAALSITLIKVLHIG